MGMWVQFLKLDIQKKNKCPDDLDKYLDLFLYKFDTKKPDII